MGHDLKNLVVQAAEGCDSISIRQLAIDVNIDAWSEADYSVEISRTDSFVLKATNDTGLAGFVLARIVPGTTESLDAEIYNVAVAPDSSRRGIGTTLLVALLAQLAKRNVSNVWLEVRESNSAAIAFYEHQGFTAELTRPNFYANPPENAVIMRLRMGQKPEVSEA